jgi:hypothetical protein
MHIQTFTSRVFNQDPTSVKKAALSAPVHITERGKVSHVLLSIEKYQELAGQTQNIVELLSMPDRSDYEIQHLDASTIKAVEFD